MKEFLNGYIFFNEIRMLRSVFKGTILLVEGCSDARVYGWFVEKLNCQVIPAHSKKNVLDALILIESAKMEGILAIADADYWRVEGKEIASGNLFLTDTHDLETMILNHPEILEKIISEYGSDNRVERLPGKIVDMILTSALPIGVLRWIATNSMNDLKLILRDLSFEKFITLTTLKINLKKLVEEVLAISKIDAPGIVESLVKKVKTILKENHDPWQICSGHDLSNLLMIGFVHIFGNKTAKSLTVKDVEKAIRLSYGLEHFRTTHLYASIQKWEILNQGYIVWKQ